MSITTQPIPTVRVGLLTLEAQICRQSELPKQIIVLVFLPFGTHVPTLREPSLNTVLEKSKKTL